MDYDTVCTCRSLCMWMENENFSRQLQLRSALVSYKSIVSGLVINLLLNKIHNSLFFNKSKHRHFRYSLFFFSETGDYWCFEVERSTTQSIANKMRTACKHMSVGFITSIYKNFRIKWNRFCYLNKYKKT